MIRSRSVLGIIAEYDPFHNGHAYHIDYARRVVSPDTVYIVLSSCMKQRGELSFFSPYMRAECAVRAGADAVFSLPVLWTIRDAEHYALGAVSLLCSLGITHLAFGAEAGDLSSLQLFADFLDNPPSAFPDILKSYLDSGSGYPSALANAVSRFFPDAADIFSRPNNILGICYLRAIKKINSSVIPVIVPRNGAYHSLSVHPAAPSASALRAAFMRGDYSSSFDAMPSYAAALVRRAYLSRRVPDISVWDTLLISAIRSCDPESLPDLSEGLQCALQKAAATAVSARDIISGLATKRYTASRISRLCAMAVLGVSAERLDGLPLPKVTLLLAIRRKKVPTDQWKDLPVRISSSAVEWRKFADPEDLLVWRIWACCCHLQNTLPFSEKIYAE